MATSAAHMPLRASVAPPAGMKSLGALRAMRVDYAKVAETVERLQPWLRGWAGF